MASTFKIILAVGGIFLAGAVTGGFVSLRFADHLAGQKQSHRRISPIQLGGRLAKQLQLTPAQKEKIDPILDRTTEALRNVRKEAFSETAALVVQMDADISKELTDEQRIRLKEIRAREAERRKRWMEERAERAERAKRQEARPTKSPAGEAPTPR